MNHRVPKHATVACAALIATLALGAGEAAGQDLFLAVVSGRATLVADHVPLRDVLAEWSRVTGAVVVNAEAIDNLPVTLTLVYMPERDALATLLRNAGGYVLTGRSDGDSSIARITIVSRRTPLVAAAAPPPGSRMQAAAPPGSDTAGAVSTSGESADERQAAPDAAEPSSSLARASRAEDNAAHAEDNGRGERMAAGPMIGVLSGDGVPNVPTGVSSEDDLSRYQRPTDSAAPPSGNAAPGSKSSPFGAAGGAARPGPAKPAGPAPLPQGGRGIPSN